MFYFRSSLFKGGAKNDAKLKTNFETCKFFRRFFKLFFSKTRSEKASGSTAPFALPAASVTPSGALAAVAAGPPSQKRVQSYTLLLKLPNFLPRNFSKTMFFSTFSTFQPSQTLYNGPNADHITSQYGFPHTKQINIRPSKNHESLFPFPQYCEKNTGWQEVNTS